LVIVISVNNERKMKKYCQWVTIPTCI